MCVGVVEIGVALAAAKPARLQEAEARTVERHPGRGQGVSCRSANKQVFAYSRPRATRAERVRG